MAVRGRPTTFTKALAARICERLSTGETLRSICREPTMPQESTVRAWALIDRNGFYAQYIRARNLGLDAMADETLDLADTPREGEKVTTRICSKCNGGGEIGEGDAAKACSKCNGSGGLTEKTIGDCVDRARLQVDTRKWYLGKMAPKRYGEKPAESDEKNDQFESLIRMVKSQPQTETPDDASE